MGEVQGAWRAWRGGGTGRCMDGARAHIMRAPMAAAAIGGSVFIPRSSARNQGLGSGIAQPHISDQKHTCGVGQATLGVAMWVGGLCEGRDAG